MVLGGGMLMGGIGGGLRTDRLELVRFGVGLGSVDESCDEGKDSSTGLEGYEMWAGRVSALSS